jgi:hypothetical protein
VVGVVAMDATVVEAAAVAEEASMVAKQRRRSSASSATESATRCYGATSRDENGQKKGRTLNHKCRKTVGMERDFSTFMKVNYYKIMKNNIKIN